MGSPYVDANDDWIPYASRVAALAKGKGAIILHHETEEAK